MPQRPFRAYIARSTHFFEGPLSASLKKRSGAVLSAKADCFGALRLSSRDYCYRSLQNPTDKYNTPTDRLKMNESKPYFDRISAYLTGKTHPYFSLAAPTRGQPPRPFGGRISPSAAVCDSEHRDSGLFTVLVHTTARVELTQSRGYLGGWNRIELTHQRPAQADPWPPPSSRPHYPACRTP